MGHPVSVGGCIRCGEPIWMTQSSYDTYLRNHQTFYCVHGHSQCFVEGESKEQKLQRELNQMRQNKAYLEDQIREARQRAEHERNRANGYKGHATRITKRAKAGVCPCCNRSFENLRRHMASQHPKFTPIELEQVGEPA